MKCVACGSTALVEGTIKDSGAAEIKFTPNDDSRVRRWLGLGARSVRAYGCVRCGHLQFAVEFSEKDLEHYQEFEGQQPSVLERLNEKSEQSDS